MDKSWLIGIIILIFITVLFFYRKFTVDSYKRENSEKMRKVWGMQTFYWEGLIYGSTGITVLILFVLKWLKVLDF